MEDSIIKTYELPDDIFKYISQLVYKECGINLHDGKKELVKSRLSRRLRKLNLNSFDEYIKFLAKPDNQHELINLLNTVSTNLTSFFREKKHFEFLESYGVKQILETKYQKQLRCWSAGCSTGEEPYTISIVLDQLKHLYPDMDYSILATDISTDVLSKATSGIYEISKTNNLDYSILKTYFKKGVGEREGFVRVIKSIRNKIKFMRFNLIEPYSFGIKFDIIFCRNVMIYFEKPIQSIIVNKFYDTLNPGGFLFVGHSESLMNINHKFRYIAPTIYQK